MTANVPEGFGTGGGRTAPRTDGGAATDSVRDPAAIAGRADVDDCEATFTHERADYCEREAAGRAIVGVTSADGLLLWVRRDGSHAILPNELVEPGEDWASAAREVVADTTGVEPDIDGVERVRAVDHVVEADDDGESDGEAAETDGERTHHRTTYHVVFSGSVARDRATALSIDECNDEWTAGWYDAIPAALDAETDESVLADLRLFLDP